MFCRNCGKELDDKAVVCPGCGVLVYGRKLEVPANLENPEAVEKKVNGLGIAAFVVSLISLWMGMWFMVPSFAALGLGIPAFVIRKKYNRCNGLAIAGFIISIVSTAFWMFMWIIFGIDILGG